MKFPWVNILLLALLVVQTLTGYFGLTNGEESESWYLWLHGVIAYTLVLLLFFKSAVILDAWRRMNRWTMQRTGFLIAFVLLISVLFSGLIWTFNGPVYLGGFSLVSLHIYAAVPLMLLMLWHSWRMRFIRRVKGATGRRLFLSGMASVAAGVVVWELVGRAKAWAGLAGSMRRFTGSYETGSLIGDFPVVSWIADLPPIVDADSWELVIDGAVKKPLHFTYEEIGGHPQAIMTATLDCTGGWYSKQRWQGVRVGELLAGAGLLPTAASVTFESVTGYQRRFSLTEADGFLLALGILAGEQLGTMELYRPLDYGHGFPARLVAPGRRGVEWVKWVRSIRVNETGSYFQFPLPLQ